MVKTRSGTYQICGGWFKYQSMGEKIHKSQWGDLLWVVVYCICLSIIGIHNQLFFLGGGKVGMIFETLTKGATASLELLRVPRDGRMWWWVEANVGPTWNGIAKRKKAKKGGTWELIWFFVWVRIITSTCCFEGWISSGSNDASMWKFRRSTSISSGKHHPKTQGVWSLPVFVGISRLASWPKNSSSYRKGGCKSMVDYTSLPNRNTWGGLSF